MQSMDIDIRQLRKTFNTTVAVDDLSVRIPAGQMLALLGPSGCGKTTTLRMVAGFIAPTFGKILVGNRDLTVLPTHKRDVGLVFQSYALFPHLSVAENIAFGLKRRGVSKVEQERAVRSIIDKLKLTGLGERLPRNLSGGQQQRVAVARALVIRPTILLLDEPFSNLDAQLRESTGLELSRLQRELSLTTIFVTHDQNEAMSIADSIAVMKDGRLQQLGRAKDIYDRPANRFVAQFIGRGNFLPGRVAVIEGTTAHIELDIGQVTLVPTDDLQVSPGDLVDIFVRPEMLTFADLDAVTAMKAIVEGQTFQGASAYLHATLHDGTPVTVATTTAHSSGVKPGDLIGLSIVGTGTRMFPSA